MICECCGEEHGGEYGSGRFCSKACSMKRIVTGETKIKISNSIKTAFKNGTAKIPVVSPEKRKQMTENLKKTWVKKLLLKDYSELKFETLRKRIIIEQNNICNHCGIDTWCGEKIILEIDHKDGDNTNNNRNNVEAICPNCHSLTSTWRGRNKNKKPISDEEIINAFLETGNIRQCLLKLGMAAKGNNYKRIKNVLKTNNLLAHQLMNN